MRYFVFLLIAISFVPSISAEWTIDEEFDPMDEEAVVTVSSDFHAPLKAITGTYSDLKAALVFRCDSESESAAIVFNAQVNPSRRNGRYAIGRAKWGAEDAKNFALRPTEANRALSFKDYDRGLLEQHPRVLFEIPWHDAGNVLLSYDLDEYQELVKEARGRCGLSGE